PAGETRGAGAGTAQGLRAASRHLGNGDPRSARDARPRWWASLLRDLPRHPVRGYRPGRVRRRRARALHRRLDRRVEGDTARAGTRDRVAPSLDITARVLPNGGPPPGP